MVLTFPQTLDIKIFEYNNKKYVLDIYTSTFLEPDDITIDIIEHAGSMDMNSLLSLLYHKYGSVKPLEALQKFCKLKGRGILSSIEESPRKKFIPHDMPVNSFSINLTYDCNLRCKYCYAGEGNYGMHRDYMNICTAEKVADFLIKTSGEANNISILFFGGEPLMNFNILKYFVLYCNSKADKKTDYTVVTNGTLLTDKIMEFFNEYNIKIQVSIDGNKKIQDFLRPFPGNIGSYDIIERKIKKITSDHNERCSARATVNHNNLELTGITKELLNMGFKYMSLEMITSPESNELHLTETDAGQLLVEYKKLADYYLNQIKEGNRFIIEGFSKTFNSTCNNMRKFYGCGVGRTFIAISPGGDIYPCHRFQGMKEWKIGDIYNGIDRHFRNMFLNIFVENIEDCAGCWARYYCGGGCIMESMVYNNSIYKPPERLCNIRKYEIELALSIYADLVKDNKDFLDSLYSNKI